MWRWVKKNITHHGQRIENHAGRGTPDAFVIVHGETLWLELKTAARPKRETTRLSLRVEQSQVQWFERYNPKHGYFLIQVGHGSTAVRALVHGGHARRLHERRWTERQLLDMATIEDVAPGTLESVL